MTGQLNGKVAIVTGGAGGIGRAICLLLAERGASVAVVDVAADRAHAIAQEIRAQGGKAVSYVTDVSSEDQIAAMVASTVADLGGVDILSNNAALLSPDALSKDTAVSIDQMTTQVWDATMAVNLRGTMLCCKYAIREMLKRGGGSIINTSSGAGHFGRVNMAAYGVSKGAVNTLTLYIATGYGKRGIRCNTVSPGFIVTPTAAAGAGEQGRTMRLRHCLTPYLGEPTDIARMVGFLASDDAKYITGQLINVDGGMGAHFPWYADQNDAEGRN